MRLLQGLMLALLLLGPATNALADGLTPVRDDGVWVYPMLYSIDYSGELAATSQRTAGGDLVDVWRFQGASGDCVQVHFRSSDVRPTVQLAQTSPNGTVVVPSAAPASDSLHPTYRLPSSDGYFIKITSAAAAQQERYELRLDRC